MNLPGMTVFPPIDGVQIHTVLPGTIIVSPTGERGTVTEDQVVASGAHIYATAAMVAEIERAAFGMTAKGDV